MFNRHVSTSDINIINKLRSELERAQKELLQRDDQCKALSRVRDEVDLEIEELTASLFEEAHKMVKEANVGRAQAEKKLNESNLQLEGIQAEVSALKKIVLTSTPANPGKAMLSGTRSSPVTSRLKRSHRRTPSEGQICTECETYHPLTEPHGENGTENHQHDLEVEPILFTHFVNWLEAKFPKCHPFLETVYQDDIEPCLRFPNEELAQRLYSAMQSNTLGVETFTGTESKCSLLLLSVICSYQVRLNDSDEWHPISTGCRSRIVAVADYLTFLRYIQLGIVKKDANVMYWEMVKLRSKIALARLGLHQRKDGR